MVDSENSVNTLSSLDFDIYKLCKLLNFADFNQTSSTSLSVQFHLIILLLFYEALLFQKCDLLKNKQKLKELRQ